MPASRTAAALMQVRLDGKATGARKTPTGTRSGCSRPWPAGRRRLGGRGAGRGRQDDERGADGHSGPWPDRPNGKIVTADALHTVKATASHIHEHGDKFVLPVKEKRRALSGALDALPWGQVPIAHTATDKGHGRITTRTIQVLPAPEDLPFPHVSQVFLIERHVTDLRGQPVWPSPRSASPARHPIRRAQRTWPATSGNSGRSSLFTGRDTLYQEDKSKVEPEMGPESWLLSATSQSGHSEWPDAPTSPSHPMGRTLYGPPMDHPRTHIMIMERPWA